MKSLLGWPDCYFRSGRNRTEKNCISHQTLFARERISQGWTYGFNEDGEKLRSPHLVQYQFVDEAIKIANRNTVILRLGDVQKLRLHKGGEGGQLGAILCKLFRLEVYIKRGEGVKNLENKQT